MKKFFSGRCLRWAVACPLASKGCLLAYLVVFAFSIQNLELAWNWKEKHSLWESVEAALWNSQSSRLCDRKLLLLNAMKNWNFKKDCHFSNSAIRFSLSKKNFLCLATLPSPVVWGWIIDKTCILWNNVCGDPTRGSCAIYNADQLRRRLHYTYGSLR